ncbi:hypothetical protein [Mariniblastus fucicola]|uniref:hypothetical protein n=1 Tax=Mariniblastus fucicola TaxID=980251 RepID=UPI0012FB7043|nr:hypothetical protein [Mariniblastus fucicola]
MMGQHRNRKGQPLELHKGLQPELHMGWQQELHMEQLLERLRNRNRQQEYRNRLKRNVP